MLKNTKKGKRTELQKAIELNHEAMKLVLPTSDEYKKLLENLDTLYILQRSAERNKVSSDVIAMGVFAIVQILIILGYEKANVLSSKALGFIFRGRV